MKVYALFGVRVMPPDPVDPQDRSLSKWQHDNAESITDALCDGKVQPVTTATHYTVQCVKSEPDGASTGRARGHFPNEQAALKCVYLALMSLDATGAGRRRWTMRWLSRHGAR